MLKEKGSVHIALLAVLILGTLGLAASSNINTTQKFFPSSQVLGEDESAQKAAEQQKEDRQINIQSEGSKQETEIQTSSGQKIKTKIEDNGATKIEVEQGDFKLKAKTEKEQTEVEKVSSASADFPISVDKTTHKLKANTPNGQRTINILPDQATTSALLDKLDGVIKLEIKNNEMVYKLKGEKKFRIFGVIPVSTPATAYVSAESGKLVEQEQSLLTDLIRLISSR